ncbi:MAG TPA: ATPase domain-containing protein [Candidatus Poseidoniales archaeon]|nr:ATPase domain-containing protein [Candidatus Poseidoniales archaeon]
MDSGKVNRTDLLPVSMIRASIPGMERLLGREPAAPYILLLTGPPGAMKSTFALTSISHHLSRTGEFGLYCTVEESVESLLRSSESVGLTLPGNLQITDFTELRSENQDMDYLRFTERMLDHFKAEQGDNFSCFVLDSLGAIYSLTEVDANMRKKMFAFFDALRRMNLFVIIITERQYGDHAEHQGNEGFLADGIINLSLDRRNGRLVRTLQIEKMRHTRHIMDKQAMEPTTNGMTIMGPLIE